MDKVFILVVVIVGILGLVIFSLKHKNYFDKGQAVKTRDTELFPLKKHTNVVTINDDRTRTVGFDEQRRTELSKITEIVLQNSLGQELTFTRPNGNTKIKYREVVIGEATKISADIFQGAMPATAQAMTIAEISKNAPNGLFTATVDPSTLSKFADGTTTTMVRDGSNKLTGHAGFHQVENLGKVNPLIAVNVGMQAMSAISGQYYLHQIFDQLNGVNSKLEKLIEVHHDEKIGILLNAKNRLCEIIQRKNVDDSDIKEIRDLRNKIGEVFQEYKTRLDRECKSVAGYKSKSLLVQKRVDCYSKEIDEMSYTLQVCFEADRLSIQAEMAEIAVRKKLDYGDPVLKELYNQLKNNCDSSFSLSIVDNIKEIFKPINLNAKEVIRNGKDFIFIDKKPDKLMKDISEKPKQLERQLNSETDSKLINQALSERNKQQEVLITLDEKLQKQRVFIPVV